MKKIVFFLIPALAILAACGPKPNDKGEYSIIPNKLSKEIKAKFNDKGGLEYFQVYSNEKPEGLYVEFFENNNPSKITFITNNSHNGPGMSFFNNGLLNNYGQYENGKRKGWFYVFDKNGNLSQKREYLNINNNDYLNQWIEYLPDGSIDRFNSNYIGLRTETDTISMGQPYKIEISLEAAYYKQFMIVVIGDFDEHFQLPGGAASDTLKATNFTLPYIVKDYKNGRNILRGIVRDLRVSETDNSKVEVRNIYFTKEFYVSAR